MAEFNIATGIFFTALLFATLIERFLEILKSAYDLADGALNMHVLWTKKAYAIRDRAVRKLRVFDHVDPSFAAPILARFSEMLVGTESGHSGEVPVLSGDLVRSLYVKGAMKVLAMGMGVALACALRIDLFFLFNADRPDRTFYFVLTGVAMGLGSSPMHKLINGLEKARQRKSARGGSK